MCSMELICVDCDLIQDYGQTRKDGGTTYLGSWNQSDVGGESRDCQITLNG
jgi:hypothetical protein